MLTALASIAALLISSADDISPASVPRDKRIEYVNLISGADASRGAHYRSAAARFEYLFEIIPEDASAEVRARSDSVEARLSNLAVAAVWSESDSQILQHWLRSNRSTLTLVTKAAEGPLFVAARDAGGGCISDEIVSEESSALFRVRKLIAVKANSCALAGDWGGAVVWNTRLHRLADQLYTQPIYVEHLMGMAIERDASMQALAFLVRKKSLDTQAIVTAATQHENAKAPIERLDQVEGVMTYELIEDQFEWAADPGNHVETGALVDLYLPGDFAPGSFSDSSNDSWKLPYATREEYRSAVLQSSIARSWQVNQKLGRRLGEWADEPFGQAWSKVADFRKSFAEEALTEPVQALLHGVIVTPDVHTKLDALTLTHRNALLTSVDVLEFIRKKGKAPKRLADVYGDSMPKHTTDPFSGKPLVYRATTDNGGFELYSIGWNQKDDGGKPGPFHESDEGDLVFWPPAD